MNMRL